MMRSLTVGRRALVVPVLALGALASGCATEASRHAALVAAATHGDGPGVAAMAQAPLAVHTVRNLPKSRRGNAPVYTVFGRQYRVLETARGFRERGIASWYGRKFHGRDTSSGERYDMHALSAAHKHLPLPTFVRVTRTDTGRSIVVKVNDRGPFVDDRVIDLSYAAAVQLDMIDQGTAPVMVEALSSHHEQRDQPAAVQLSQSATTGTGAGHYIQLGAFSQQPNAESLLEQVAGGVPLPVRISHDPQRALYRVQLGPVESVELLDEILSVLPGLGVQQYTLVSVAE